MAVNRYNLPAQQPLINTYQPLPFKELLAAGQSVQSQKDLIEQQRQALADTNFYALDPDIDYVTGQQQQLLSDTDSITDLYSTGNIRDAKRAYNEIARKWKKELNPLTGRTGKSMANYDNRAAYYKSLKENKNLKPFQIQKAMDFYDKNYADQGGVGEDLRNMQGYNHEELEDYLDWSDFMMNHGKEVRASIDAYADVSFGGYDEAGNPQYVYKKKGTNEELAPEEIYRALVGDNYNQGILGGLVGGSGRAKAYLEQGSRIGYTSPEEMINALYGTGEALSYRKESRDKSISGNPHYQYKDKLRREQAANYRGRAQSVGHFGRNTEDLAANYRGSKQRLSEIPNEIVRKKEELNRTKNTTKGVQLQQEINRLEREQAQLEQQTSILDQAVSNAIGEISQTDATNIEIISKDGKTYNYENKNVVAGFYDENGKYVNINNFDSSGVGEFNLNDPAIQKYMADNNLTPVHPVHSFVDENNQVDQIIRRRGFATEDFVITHITDADLKDSPTLNTMNDDLKNHPENFEVWTVGADGNYVNTGQNFKETYKDYNKNNSMFGFSGQVKPDASGKTAVDKGMISGFVSEQNAMTYVMPNGDQVLLKPRGGSEENFQRNKAQAYYELYSRTGNEEVLEEFIKEDNKAAFKQIDKNISDFSNQEGRFSNIMMEPVKIEEGIYLHAARTDDPSVLTYWYDDSKEAREPENVPIEEIRTTNPNGLKDALTEAFKIKLTR